VTTTRKSITKGIAPTEGSAEHAETKAGLAGACQARAETAGLTAWQAGAGVAPQRLEECQEEAAARLLNDASTAVGQAYARAFSDNAATYVRELRERDPLPEPDRTPGAPHPDPLLASRGWHMNQHGIYTRRTGPESEAAPQPERELEAEP
jgi:hypothetical protein